MEKGVGISPTEREEVLWCINSQIVYVLKNCNHVITVDIKFQLGAFSRYLFKKEILFTAWNYFSINTALMTSVS